MPRSLPLPDSKYRMNWLLAANRRRASYWNSQTKYWLLRWGRLNFTSLETCVSNVRFIGHLSKPFVPVRNRQELEFACHVSSAYHNSIAYNAVEDDGFAHDMQQRELTFRDGLAHSINFLRPITTTTSL